MSSNNSKYTVEEDVPNGYTAKITGDMETGFTITNTVDVPDTGDNNDVILWSAAIIISMLAIVLLVIRRRKARKAR